MPASWTLQDKAYQQLIDDNDVVSLYLTADEVHHQRVYAICNLADTSVVAWDKVQTVEALRTRNITIEKPDGAYTGKYVMCGFCKIDYGATLAKEYTIEVKRLAAKFDFDIFSNRQIRAINLSSASCLCIISRWAVGCLRTRREIRIR